MVLIVTSTLLFLLGYRQFWRRHSRKVYATLGVLGSGYLLYKLYGSIKRRSREFEIALALENDNDKLLKAQLRVPSFNTAFFLLLSFSRFHEYISLEILIFS